MGRAATHAFATRPMPAERFGDLAGARFQSVIMVQSDRHCRVPGWFTRTRHALLRHIAARFPTALCSSYVLWFHEAVGQRTMRVGMMVAMMMGLGSATGSACAQADASILGAVDLAAR